MVYWSKLFGVLSWIAAIFTILALTMVNSDIPFPSSSIFLGVLMVVLYIYSGNLFLRFSKTTRARLNDQNKDTLAGFISMGRLFTFWGSLCYFTLSLYSYVFW